MAGDEEEAAAPPFEATLKNLLPTTLAESKNDSPKVKNNWPKIREV